MKRWFFILYVLFLGSQLAAQIAIKFNRTYSLNGFPNAPYGISATNGGYILYGAAQDTAFKDNISPSPSVAYIMKIDTLGNTQWIKYYGKKGFNYTYFLAYAGCGIKQVPWGGYIGAGYLSNDSTTWLKIMLFRFNNAGDTLWSKVYTDSTVKERLGFYVKIARKHRFILGGATANFNVPSYQYRSVLMEIDSSGNVIWHKTYPTTPPNYQMLTGIDTCSDGGFIMCQRQYDSTYTCTDRIVVTKVDSVGNIKWSQTINSGTPCSNIPGGIVALKKGGYVISGLRDSTTWPYSCPSLYLVKLDNAGGVVWKKRYAKGYGQGGWQMLIMPYELANGDIIACGNAIYNNEGTGVLLKVDSSGVEKWIRYIAIDTPACVDYLLDIKPTNDNGFVSTGYTYSNPEFTWVIKTDSLGCTDSAGCSFFSVNQVQNQNEVANIYPNPNNGKFNLLIKSSVISRQPSVEIYNMLGEKVYVQKLTVVNCRLSINQPGGIYFYRIITESGEPISSGKFIVN